MDPKPVGAVRIDRRRSLLSGFDSFRRELERGNELEQVDAFTEQAFGVLTSSQLGDALDLENEDPRIRERYGKGDPKNVGDGAPRNNLMDPWTELREAALLAKAKQGRADALPAAEVFELATREGARALGLLDQTGSLEEGKKADLAIVDLGGLHQEPGGDVYSRLVYATRPTDVRHVWADGRQLVDEGRVTTLDEAQVRTAARREAKRCAARAGLG